jgi:superfamily II DNA or RNA helicase
MELFPYQKECIDALRIAASQGEKRLLVKAPCSFGKTIVFCQIAVNAREKGRKVLIVMDSVFLVEQTVMKLRNFTNDVGIYCATLNKKEMSTITVSTIQSIKENIFDIVLVDECHSGQSRWQEFLNDMQIVIGFTATPYDAKGRAIYGSDRFFPGLTYSMSVNKLLELNRITPMIYGTEKDETKIDLSSVKIQAGDYKESDLQKVYEIEKDKVVMQLEDMLLRVANRKKVIIMTTGIDHADFIESRLSNSLAYHSKIDNKRRSEILKEFEHGSIKFLIGVMAIYKGLDITSVDCIANMRPTRSKNFWVQLCGRGVRKHPGKVNCLMLDYGQTVENLGFYEDIEEINKKVTKGLAPEFFPKKCPSCLALLKPQIRICGCGHVFTVITTDKLEKEAFQRAKIENYKHEIESVVVNHEFVSKKGFKMKTIRVGLVDHVDLMFFYPEFKRGEFFSIIKELSPGKKLIWGYKENYPQIRGIE